GEGVVLRLVVGGWRVERCRGCDVVDGDGGAVFGVAAVFVGDEAFDGAGAVVVSWAARAVRQTVRAVAAAAVECVLEARGGVGRRRGGTGGRRVGEGGRAWGRRG